MRWSRWAAVTTSSGVSTSVAVERAAAARLGREGRARRQVHALDLLGADLVDGQRERVALDQVPGVAGQLAAHVGDDPRRAEQVDVQLAGEKDAQQVVEADEVVHVRVRHEHVRDLEQRRRRLAVDAAEVEQHRPPLVAQADVEAGIAERRVDQSGDERGAHGGSGAYRGSMPFWSAAALPLWGGGDRMTPAMRRPPHSRLDRAEPFR